MSLRRERTTTLVARTAPGRRLLSGLAPFFHLFSVRGRSFLAGARRRPTTISKPPGPSTLKGQTWAGQGLQAPRKLVGDDNRLGKAAGLSCPAVKPLVTTLK
jgi:hypothetical protein